MPQTFDTRTLLIARRDTAMALAMAVREMKEENKTQLEEIKKAVVAEMKDELQTLIREETRYAAEQELKGRKALHLLSETEQEEISDMATEKALVKIPKFFPKDGITPIKGVNYWTQTEINEIAQYLFGALKKDLQLVAGQDYPTEEQMCAFMKVEMAKMPKYDEKVLLEKLKLQFPKVELKGEDI